MEQAKMDTKSLILGLILGLVIGTLIGIIIEFATAIL